MIYLVQTLKQVKEQMLNTDFVIQADNESDIKTIMNFSKVIVLGSTIVPGWPKSGKIFVDLENEGKKIKCCVAAESLEQACDRCIMMGLPIIRIQNKEIPISEELSHEIIEKAKNLYREKEEMTRKIVIEEKKKIEQSVDNRKQKRIAEIITQTLKDIDEISEEIKNNPIFLSDIRKLNINKEVLTKMKMGSNIEKSSIILEETLAIMEKIEIESINSMKKQEEIVLDTSVVSNVDVVGELEKLKRSKQVNDAGISKNKSDMYYTLFGIVGLYQKFIAKDVISRLSKIKDLIKGSIEYSYFGIIRVSILTALRMASQVSQEIIISKETYKYIISLGILGLLRNIPLAFRNKRSLLIILSIIVAIGLLILIQQLLIVNLALL